MAAQSIANVTLLAGTVETRSAGDSGGTTAVTRQRIAGAAVEVESSEAVSQEALQEAVSQLQEYVQKQQREMDFSVDDATGRFVVKVYDRQTQELIRQIPSEEMLAISRHIAAALEGQEEAKGFLIELKA
ncbi:MAG TPA: flagellar protein FlaG [Gammaproteobacteria bacterium]|nr:flagellar protein FlaG [Gammaproteobacteria bacterium]